MSNKKIEEFTKFSIFTKNSEYFCSLITIITTKSQTYRLLPPKENRCTDYRKNLNLSLTCLEHAETPRDSHDEKDRQINLNLI